MSEYAQKIGTPFRGKEKEQLKEFLQEQELEYDENITWTMVILDGKKIIASGSCHGNIIKCIAVSPDYQGQNLLGAIMTRLVAHLFEQGITHYFGFTKPRNKEIFCNMGLYPVAETDQVLLLENRKNGLKKYVEKLQLETQNQLKRKKINENGYGNGAIVANCNPFTLGHQYLIENAAKQCQMIHLFILSEEQGFFSTQERFDMVKAGVSHIPNVILHGTSDYLISPAVFPTYFIKEKQQAFSINCMLDIEIFIKYIAKALNITKRFIGTEPSCQVTGQYNQCLKKTLPLYGIEVEEVERLSIDNQIISASRVREQYEKDQLSKLAFMLPETTMDYLKQREKKEGKL